MKRPMKSILAGGLAFAMLATSFAAVPTVAQAESAVRADGSYDVARNDNRHGNNWKHRNYNSNRHGQNWNGNRYGQNWNGYRPAPRPGWNNAYRPGMRPYHPAWNGPGYYVRPGYGRYYYNDYNAALAAGVFGLAAGAIIGSAVSQPRYATSDYIAYCSQRYRSFNPRTGTYTGYDGLQHRCIAP